MELFGGQAAARPLHSAHNQLARLLADTASPQATVLNACADPALDAALRRHGLQCITPESFAQRPDMPPLPLPDKSVDWAVFSFSLHTLEPEAREAALAEVRRVAQRLALADYVLAERNLYFPVTGLACLAERLAGGHFKAYRAFMQAGGLFGLCQRQSLTVLAEAPVLANAGAAVLVE